MLMHVSRYLFSKLLLLCKNGLVWVEQNPSWSDVFRTDLTSLRLCCSDQMWFRLKEERRARTKFPAVINKTLLLNRCGRHRINTAMVLPWKSLVQQTPGYVCGCSSEGEVTREGNMGSMLPRHSVLARSVAVCFAHRKPSADSQFFFCLPQLLLGNGICHHSQQATLFHSHRSRKVHFP